MNKITSRKKSRKYLFQKLYSLAYNNNSKKDFDNSFLIDSYKDNLDEKYITEQEKNIIGKQNELVEILKMYAPKFIPKKMDLTYVIPIFIGASEMLYFSEEIPAKVSINEAIELSKLYGTETTKKIVNAVLNKVYINFKQVKKELEELEQKDEYNFFKN